MIKQHKKNARNIIRWISLGENRVFFKMDLARGECEQHGSRSVRMEALGRLWGSLGVPWEEEEATKKRQEERRKTQHDRSKKKEGSTNTKGKQKQKLYVQTRDQPLLAAPYYR